MLQGRAGVVTFAVVIVAQLIVGTLGFVFDKPLEESWKVV